MRRRVFSTDATHSPIAPDSLVLFAETDEPRSRYISSLVKTSINSQSIQVSERESKYEVELGRERLSLRDTEGIAAVLGGASRSRLYIDMTGLTHSAWAPLVKAALHERIPCSVLYVEPDSYRFSAVGTDGEIFDLSDRIDEIRPIPGFEAIGLASDDTYFVPLLGFEGIRFSHLLANIDVAPNQVRPIVGAPGYQLEFPSYTFLGNADALAIDSHWTRVQYARADCAFSLYHALSRLRQNGVGAEKMMIAPIGTKPHALGAVLYVLCSGTRSELVYDHPKRSAGRTTGVGKLIEFPLDAFSIAGD